MKLPITLFQDEDGMFIAECPRRSQPYHPDEDRSQR